MYEYCAECAHDWENNRLGCMTYQDVTGTNYDDCEKQLKAMGWIWDNELGWLCPVHAPKEGLNNV